MLRRTCERARGSFNFGRAFGAALPVPVTGGRRTDGSRVPCVEPSGGVGFIQFRANKTNDGFYSAICLKWPLANFKPLMADPKLR